jgi:hypothetical protein
MVPVGWTAANPFALQLEELDDIFNAPNPRNASLVKKKVALDGAANVVEVEKM